MKKIILVVLIQLLFLNNVFCQEPNQAEIDKMMKDAKEMLSKFQQQGKDSSLFKQGTKKNVVIKPASSIELIYLKQPLQIPTEAQAKDHLLWYKGKKMNDSMLVTTQGMVVLYSQKRNKVIAQPLEKKDPFRNLVNNLSKTVQMTEDYLNKQDEKKNSFMDYPLIQMTVDEFQDIDERLNAAIKNTIDLPALSVRPIPKKSKGSDMELDFSPEEDLAEMQNQLKELLNNEPDMSFKPPPKRNFSLAYLCDANAQKRYAEERRKWEDEFLAYENQLMNLVMKISSYIQATHNLPPIRTEPGAPTLNDDLKDAVTRSLSRSDEKLKLLTGQNGKNVFTQDCVIQSILQNERKKQILGFSKETDNLNVVSGLLESAEFENYINEEINNKNWDVIFNYSITLGRNRQTQLMGAPEAPERLNQLTLRIINLNRFTLTAEVDFNVEYTDDDGKPAIKASGKIETTDKVYVSLSRTRDGCKWTLMLSEIDYGNAKKDDYYIPIRVTGGTKLIKDDKDHWITYPYSGPKDMLMHFPVFSINFSDTYHSDTATLEPAKYLSDENQTANSITQAYTTDFLGFMNNVYIVVSNAEANNENIMDVAKEMMSRFSGLTVLSPGLTVLDKLRSKYLLMQQKQEAEQKTAAASFSAKFVVLFNAVNGSSTLVDQSVDTKHKDENLELTKGIIKIKVVHDPVD